MSHLFNRKRLLVAIGMAAEGEDPSLTLIKEKTQQFQAKPPLGCNSLTQFGILAAGTARQVPEHGKSWSLGTAQGWEKTRDGSG